MRSPILFNPRISFWIAQHRHHHIKQLRFLAPLVELHFHFFFRFTCETEKKREVWCISSPSLPLLLLPFRSLSIFSQYLDSSILLPRSGMLERIHIISLHTSSGESPSNLIYMHVRLCLRSIAVTHTHHCHVFRGLYSLVFSAIFFFLAGQIGIFSFVWRKDISSVSSLSFSLRREDYSLLAVFLCDRWIEK